MLFSLHLYILLSFHSHFMPLLYQIIWNFLNIACCFSLLCIYAYAIPCIDDPFIRIPYPNIHNKFLLVFKYQPTLVIPNKAFSVYPGPTPFSKLSLHFIVFIKVFILICHSRFFSNLSPLMFFKIGLIPAFLPIFLPWIL